MRKLLIGLATLSTFAATPAFAGTAYLVRSWIGSGGNTFCEYTNGSVINVGGRACPTTIQT